MAGGPIWYELMTPDPAAVTPYYHAVLGWDIPAEGNAMPNGAEYRTIARKDGGRAGGVLTLNQGMLDAGARPCWFAYFHVEDVEAALDKAISLGASVWMGVQDEPEAGRMALIADPQGAPFYIISPTPPPGMEDMKIDVFDPAKPGHCRWMQLDTTDAPAANDFYTTLFGWSTRDTMPMGDAGDYRFIDFEGTRIGAFNPMIGDGQQPLWLLYFGVEDIEAARAAVLANGGTVALDVHQVPGGDWIFVSIDPAGATVAFVGPRGE